MYASQEPGLLWPFLSINLAPMLTCQKQCHKKASHKRLKAPRSQCGFNNPSYPFACLSEFPASVVRPERTNGIMPKASKGSKAQDYGAAYGAYTIREGNDAHFHSLEKKSETLQRHEIMLLPEAAYHIFAATLRSGIT